MKQRIKNLSNEELQSIILKIMDLLPEEQCEKLEAIIEECITEKDEEQIKDTKKGQLTERMSREFVEEKMQLLRKWMEQIDEGELYLDVDEYEDYSGSYWDSDWIIEYYDYQVQDPKNRAKDIYLYFSRYTFQKLHIQDMFYAGREELDGKEQFWSDWIALLQTKSGESESSLCSFAGNVFVQIPLPKIFCVCLAQKRWRRNMVYGGGKFFYIEKKGIQQSV